MEIYVLKDGEQMGPFSKGTIATLISDGSVGDSDLAWHEGLSDWVPLSKILGNPKAPAAVKPVARPSTTPASEIGPKRSAFPFVPVSIIVAIGIAAAIGLPRMGFHLRTSDAPGSAPLAVVRTSSLRGQIFIVTEGGDNFKLGDVHVGIYKAEDLQRIFAPLMDAHRQAIKDADDAVKAAEGKADKLRDASTAALNAWAGASYDDPNRDSLKQKSDLAESNSENASKEERDAEAVYEQAESPSFYYNSLPTPIVETTTDADGMFTLEIPTTGTLIVAANASRRVGEKTEEYYWLRKIDIGGGGKEQTMLSNDTQLNPGLEPDFTR